MQMGQVVRLKKMNKVLILFLFAIGIMFVFTWEFLQSQWVAKQISTYTTKYITEVLDSEVEFGNLQFNLFPPGATAKNVRFRANPSQVSLNIEANEVGVFFNPFDVFETNFRIDSIKIKDGQFSVNLLSTKNKVGNTPQTKNNSSDIFAGLEDIPINNIELEDVLAEMQSEKVFIAKTVVQNKKTELEFEGVIEAVDLGVYVKKPLFIDSLEVAGRINRQRLDIKSLKAKSNFKEVYLEGQVNSYLSSQREYDLQAVLKLPAAEIQDHIDLSRVGLFQSGKLKSVVNVSGRGSDYKVNVKVEGAGIRSDYIDADLLEMNAKIDSDGIALEKLRLAHGDSRIELKDPFSIYNFSTKTFIEDPVLLKLEAAELGNILKYTKEKTNFIGGAITGELRFDLYQQSFGFRILEGSFVDRLNIELDQGSKIFQTDRFEFEQGTVSINNSELDLNIELKSGESRIAIIANTENGIFNLKIPNSFIELNKISPLLGREVTGKGLLDLSMRTDKRNSQLWIKADMNQLSIDGFRLEKVRSSLSIDLNSGQLSLKRVYGASGKASFLADGLINLRTSKIDATYKVKNASFSELKKVLIPVLKDTTITTNEIHGFWSLSGKASGKVNLDELSLTGSFKGKNNYIFNESLDNVKFNYLFRGGRLNIDNFNAKKSGGSVGLEMQYDFQKGKLDFKSRLSEIPIQELAIYKRLPLQLRGDLSGAAEGSLMNQRWQLKTDLKLTKSFSSGQAYPNSSLTFVVNDTDFETYLNLFGGQVVVNNHLYLNIERTEKSFFNVDLNIPNLRALLGVTSLVDMSNNMLSGRVRYTLRSTIDPLSLKLINLETNMMNFVLNKKPITVRYKDNNPEIIVENSVIKKWDVNIRGKKFYIMSKGEGDLSRDFSTLTQSKIDASIIEVFNTLFSKATGNMRANIAYDVKNGSESYEAFLTSDNLTLASELIPTAVTNADMRISFTDRVFEIEKFNAELISGALGMTGRIGVKSIVPDVNLKFKFKDAGLILFKKSNLTFSGQGSLVGNSFPYNLGGELFIENFVLVNELTDFTGGETNFVENEIKYLPGGSQFEQDQLLAFNVNVAARNPIFIRNSLADLGFTGGVRIQGGEQQPRLSGKINLAPRRNKVNFKNTDFVFSKGNIFFNAQNEYSNPELDFSANTIINQYSVNVGVVGPVKNFNVDLTSQPALSQSDILSLIAFGYTEDLSNNLSDTERETMTRAGVGAIIFDSFKINETLKKEFGLQVNLGTQLSQDEGSLLAGRNTEGANNNRVRSATTFEIKKKINDAMTLSVSSTVGTSTEQRQGINLNYNLNKNVSVEGVYENRNTDQVETINVDTSVGADVKWKWSFK